MSNFKVQCKLWSFSPLEWFNNTPKWIWFFLYFLSGSCDARQEKLCIIINVGANELMTFILCVNDQLSPRPFVFNQSYVQLLAIFFNSPVSLNLQKLHQKPTEILAASESCLLWKQGSKNKSRKIYTIVHTCKTSWTDRQRKYKLTKDRA